MTAVIHTYRLSPVAVGLGVNGLGCSFVGNALALGGHFDVLEALAAVGAEEFSVCDNALKQALDSLEWLERVS